jgi:response regulator RpfG family c-di-GMP phosphodiesterase
MGKMSSAGQVLVVDDDPANVRLIERVLESAGYEVLTAYSGQQALDMIAGGVPHVIILDIMMPHMSGFEVCSRLREDPRTQSVPIIVLTALDDVDNRISGIETGADEYMTKPFHVKELVARVASVMRTRTLGAALEESLGKVRRFNTFVENVTMGLDVEQFVYDRLERLIMGQFMAGGVPMRRAASLLLAGVSGGSAAGMIRCSAYYVHDSQVELLSGPVMVPDVIRSLPMEMSIGLRYGKLSTEAAEAVSGALPANVNERVGRLCDAAIFSEGRLYLAAFNYCLPVTQFDAELLRGLSLYLALSGRLSRLASESDEAFRYVVDALARAAEANDTDTGNHIVRVNVYAELLAAGLGMSQHFVSDIAFQAQLHDVGKIHIDPQVLRKRGELTAEEWEIMKQHTLYGAKIIGDSPRLAMARSIALTHHERFDGRGYPRGLKGEEIPIEGRIVAVADVYDAVRNVRAYKKAQSHDIAVNVILGGDEKVSASGFDPRVVEVFKRLAGRFNELYESMK